MLQDLDATLRAMLAGELPSALQPPAVTISFLTPGESYPPPSLMLPAIDAFLCAIRENRELRDGDRVQRRTADGGVVISTAPVRVDCHYVFTVNATPGGDPNLEDEHRILGEVMRVLLRFRQIPARYLQGCLVDMEPPVRAASILPPGGHESGSDLWTALKQTMRACLHYTVTIAVDPGLPTEAATPVTSIQFSGGV